MKLNEYITQARADILAYLEKFIMSKKDIHPDLPYFHETLQVFKTFIPQGKLMRGILVMLAAESYEFKRSDELLAAALAIEVTHSTLLIHDDIMDQDETRRGNTTVYSKYKKIAETSHISQSLLYGQSMAICIGDIGLYLGIDALMNCSSKPDMVSKIMKYFVKEIQYTGAAQMDDVALGHMNTEPDKDQIKRIYTYKTGRYTFSLPLMMGGYLAGVPDKDLQIMDTMGEELGVTFQIRDDYIGLTGSEEIIGKPAGSDIKQNKKTLLRAMLFERITSEDKKAVESLFGKQDLTKSDVDYVVKMMKMHNVFSDVEELNTKTVSNCLTYINNLSMSSEYKSLFNELVLLNTTRSK